MPARKPSGLNVRHDTAAEKEARISAEEAIKPKRRLPTEEPAALRGHQVAAREWRRLMAMYNDLEAEIVSRLDMGMLLDYCILIEQLADLDELRAGALDEWRSGKITLEKIRAKLDDPDGGVTVAAYTKAAEAVNWLFDKVVKVDGRVDRKRALLLQLRQSLYLTPRSRAGVNPEQKPVEEPEDELTMLLGS